MLQNRKGNELLLTFGSESNEGGGGGGLTREREEDSKRCLSMGYVCRSSFVAQTPNPNPSHPSCLSQSNTIFIGYLRLIGNDLIITGGKGGRAKLLELERNP